MSRRHLVLSLLSGCIWGLIAWAIGALIEGPPLRGGIIVSPLIGLVIGTAFRPIARLSPLGQAIMSLLSLYVAAALFGLGIGLYDWFTGNRTDRIFVGVVIQSALGTLWGLTFMGWVFLLWPLAFLNHRILDRVPRRD